MSTETRYVKCSSLEPKDVSDLFEFIRKKNGLQPEEAKRYKNSGVVNLNSVLRLCQSTGNKLVFNFHEKDMSVVVYYEEKVKEINHPADKIEIETKSDYESGVKLPFED